MSATDNSSSGSALKLGWEEWLALPDLGLPAIKAKIDTGARTSALHAMQLEPFGSDSDPKVRFTVHPIPGNYDLAIPCSAPVKDLREVTSSNGETELRYVIETTLQFGDNSWPIEVTLTDRSGMAYHMLLGRMALVERCVVVPGESHQQPDLSYDAYRLKPAKAATSRPLRVALLTNRPDTTTARMIIAEGDRRGHSVEPIAPDGLQITTSTTAPQISRNGKTLPHYDAVIPRVTASAYNTALLRQFEVLGAYSPNAPDGLAAAQDTLRAQQILARNLIAIADTTFPMPDGSALPADDIEVLITGKRLRVMARNGDAPVKLTAQERRTAHRAARAFKLGFAQLALQRTDAGLQVLSLSARPDLSRLKASGRKAPAAALFDLIENQARPRPKLR